MPSYSLAILQPYFCPYLGYFQLINQVDRLVLYDNIEYSRRGWISRNQFILNSKERLFSIPLKRASDYSNINDRVLAGSHEKSVKKILGQIESSYRTAPFFSEIFPVIRSVFMSAHVNLFYYNLHSITVFTKLLSINTEILKSSDLKIDHSLKSQSKVIRICQHLGADTYINPIGGVALYNKKVFEQNGLTLKFLRMNKIKYDQYNSGFIPNLSIIDVLMFNGVEKTKNFLSEYTLE